MSLFNLFDNKKEKEIMGAPSFRFFVNLYTFGVENHINAMVPFVNNFIQNRSIIETEPAGSPGSMAFTRTMTEEVLQDIFRYYYFLFNEYVFPKIKNHTDIDYKLFKERFSKELDEGLNSTTNYKSFLYDSDLLKLMHSDMLDEDKSIPQFYKEILIYYYPEKIGPLLKEPMIILTPYIQSSDLINSRPPNTKINEDGLLYFFARVFSTLKCLPRNYEYMNEEYEQFNSDLFDELLKLMIDNTYNSLTIQTAVNQAL